MAISFNNIPTTTRTPNVYAEVDNSRALQGLAANPHKALILGQKLPAALGVETNTLIAITKSGLADGYFGPGSILARMCNTFKDNNPNTELFAIALDSAGVNVNASAVIKFDSGLSVSGAHTFRLMINGVKVPVALTSGMTATTIGDAIVAAVNANSNLPVVAVVSASAAGSDHVVLSAVCSGLAGNYLDARHNYYDGESNPFPYSASGIKITKFSGGANNPDVDAAWAAIAGEQFHYIINPYIDATNLAALETELDDRFLPTEDLQGHAFTGLWCSDTPSASADLNNAHNTIMAIVKPPNAPEEWAAACGAQAAFNLNNDPARPLHFLKMKSILAPALVDRPERTEREVMLTDGIATWIVDTGGNVLIERCITSYQTNALGIADVSYLDVQTLATLSEIRYQYKARMGSRFIVPRFKLADDTFPVQPGSKVVTPKTIKTEIIALFQELQDIGLVENMANFIDNLIVERNATDVNRVDVLMPPDLINQFRVLAGLIQYIL